jgi:hypothetical protein
MKAALTRAAVAAVVAGAAAFDRGLGAVPTMDPTAMDLAGRFEDAGERSEVLAAWVVGWHSRNLAEGSAR